jgi:hypothetical protein
VSSSAPYCRGGSLCASSGHSLSTTARISSEIAVTPLAPASRLLFGCNPNLGILKDGRERSAAAVREGIRPALTIVRDESPDGHGLHRMVDDAYRAVINASRDAEQNHAVLCAEFCRRLFLGLLPPPAFCERRHRGLARRLEPCVGVPAKRREAAVEASAASGAAASVASAAAWGNAFPVMAALRRCEPSYTLGASSGTAVTFMMWPTMAQSASTSKSKQSADGVAAHPLRRGRLLLPAPLAL